MNHANQKPSAAALLRNACRISTEFLSTQFLMANNAYGRWNGSHKEQYHDELCRFYVAMVHQIRPDAVRETASSEADYQSVRRTTQALTDHLDSIGFPLTGRPDYDGLVPLFFEGFHCLALEALGLSAYVEAPA